MKAKINMTTDVKRMQDQEEHDFQLASAILKHICSGCSIEISGTPTWTKGYDLTATVQKGLRAKTLTVEVKTRNQDLKRYPNIPLTVKKYIYLRDAALETGGTPIYMVIVNNTDYFLFNTNWIDFNDIELINWNIQKVQYNCEGSTETQPTPTFFLRPAFAIHHGKLKDINGLDTTTSLQEK